MHVRVIGVVRGAFGGLRAGGLVPPRALGVAGKDADVDGKKRDGQQHGERERTLTQ